MGWLILTRNYHEFAPQIRKPNFGYVDPVNGDLSGCGFDKAEERQCQCALSTPGPSQHTNPFSWLHSKTNLVQNIREVRLVKQDEFQTKK